MLGDRMKDSPCGVLVLERSVILCCTYSVTSIIEVKIEMLVI